MRIRLPGKKRRWVHVSLKTMCILAILIAIISTLLGLPAIMEFPSALIAIGAYAVYELIIWDIWEAHDDIQEHKGEHKK